MRVFIDTNILLDHLIGREPYFQSADKIIKLCAEKKIQGYIAAHSITNMFYILRKDMSEKERREALLELCKILRVEGIDSVKIISGLKNKKFSDFEDCLQEECAAAIKADYIITRNKEDYAFSELQCSTAEEFLEALEEKDI